MTTEIPAEPREFWLFEPAYGGHGKTFYVKEALGDYKDIWQKPSSPWMRKLPPTRLIEYSAYKKVCRERDLAIAHDSQPYPTVWAYEQACKERDKLQAENTALREALQKIIADTGEKGPRVIASEALTNKAEKV